MPCALVRQGQDILMHIETTRFGALSIEESRVLTFPDGLPGFEACRRFTLVPHPAPEGEVAGPFEWLQSVEDGALAFLAIDPRRIFTHYKPALGPSELQSIALDCCESGHLLSLLTVPKGDPCGITANLLAPVIVNPDTRQAKQVILTGDEYGVRHRLLPN